MDMFRKMALAIGIITAFNPGAHVWFEDNILHIENNGKVTEIRYQVTDIGTAWSHTYGEEPVEK